MFLKNVRVKVRRAQLAGAFYLSQQDKLVQSVNIANIQNVIFASENGIDMAVGINDSLPKMMEFDLGENIRVETLMMTNFIDNNQNNHGMNVKLLANTRPTINMLVPTTDASVNYNFENFMDASGIERERSFFSSNDIKVIFDNADMIKLMKVDRSDRNLLSEGPSLQYGPDGAGGAGAPGPMAAEPARFCSLLQQPSPPPAVKGPSLQYGPDGRRPPCSAMPAPHQLAIGAGKRHSVVALGHGV
jgi:hypothetical protein